MIIPHIKAVIQTSLQDETMKFNDVERLLPTMRQQTICKHYTDHVVLETANQEINNLILYTLRRPSNQLLQHREEGAVHSLLHGAPWSQDQLHGELTQMFMEASDIRDRIEDAIGDRVVIDTSRSTHLQEDPDELASRYPQYHYCKLVELSLEDEGPWVLVFLSELLKILKNPAHQSTWVSQKALAYVKYKLLTTNWQERLHTLPPSSNTSHLLMKALELMVNTTSHTRKSVRDSEERRHLDPICAAVYTGQWNGIELG
jgi:hypothetical protein